MNTRTLLLTAALGAGLSLSAAATAGTIEGTLQHAKGNANFVVSVVVPGASVSPPATNPAVDQKDMRFIPDLLVVVKGTTVDFKNDDPVNHNVFSPDGEAYNLGTWPQGELRSYTFSSTGAYVQLCSLHPEMEAYVVVVDTPYYATTDSEGHFTIDGVPDGHYEVNAWGAKLKKSERSETFSVDVADGKGTLAISWED